MELSLNDKIEPMETEEIITDVDNSTKIDNQVSQTTIAAQNAAPMEDDEVRSEATFNFKVENLSKLKDSVLSPPCYVRNLPWKIMAMSRTNNEARSLGFFLQCNGESESANWSCNAIAELKIHTHKAGTEVFSRKIKHTFYSKENDWGFSHFLSWNEIYDPEKGYVEDDSILLEVHVTADAPHGVFWDSKKHTGFVGLKNQGATCYMNSLLQTLYFTNELRKAVYKMPTEADDSTKSVALALQRVFHDLQFTDKPVGTKKLTKSFGWETLDSLMQHDVQEFLRVLLDKLESKMKGTVIEGTVPKLFEGKMLSFIKCKNIEYESTRSETFYDIQLNIKGKKNIEESFKDYIATETLEGDNKYDAGSNGLQEAEKGVIFKKFPPVLHLHLMRFQYDPITDNSVKFNDRFEFNDHINLDEYLQEKEETPADYTLHAVLVHSGDNHGGHYVVYINPKGDGNWCKFDDDVVSGCSKNEAIDQNYGGPNDELNLNAKHSSSNAYMLVYIRDSALVDVLQEITINNIPTELDEKLREEKRMEHIRRQERTENNTIMSVHILLEDYFESHQTTGLFDIEKTAYRIFKIKKTAPISELIESLSAAFRISADDIRLWPIIQRSHAIRPSIFDYRDDLSKPVVNCSDLQNPWIVFMETLPSDLVSPSKNFNKDRDILLFFKCYDPVLKRLNYCGLSYYNQSTRIVDIIPELNKRAGYPEDTELSLYEERGASSIEKIVDHNESLNKVITDVMNGDIIIFEKKYKDENLELATCKDYFLDLLYRVDVTFIDKSNSQDVGFTLELSQRMTYDQMATAVSQKINVDPYNIQFFKCQNYKDIPGAPLRSSYDGSLKDLLVYTKPKSVKKIFYQKLSMNINELESKKQFKCLWIDLNLKEEKELILYPNKNGTVKTLLEEAAKQIEVSKDGVGSGQLRIVEINGNKIIPGPTEETLLEYLQSSGESSMTNQKVYRIEEIPSEELDLDDDEMLIPVVHFFKDVYSTFGTPFYIKAKQGELFVNFKERIQKKLSVPEKEWEKYKLAVIASGHVDYLTDEYTNVSLNDFKPPTNQPSVTQPYLGLEHLNKAQKRGRFNYAEKAIKIYN